MTLFSTSDLTRIMRERKLLAVNIQLHGNEFRVHVRNGPQYAFTCAQSGHADVATALAEHFGKPSSDLSDLLE